MRLNTPLVVSLAILGPAWIASAADIPGPKLAEHDKTDAIDPVAAQPIGVLKWGRGAFVFDAVGEGSVRPFYTLDRSGRRVSSSALTIPGASRISISDFDRGSDGVIVCAGQAWSGSDQGAPFIAWISSDGNTERVVRMAPYYAYELAVAPDGTTWTLGLEMLNGDPRNAGLDPNAPVLRHFDLAGKLIGSAWPQSAFTGNSQTARSELARIGFGRLVASKDRLGWYSSIARDSKYVEVSFDTLAERAYPGLGLQFSDKWWDGAVRRLALTDAGDVVVSIDDHTAHKTEAYTLDRGTSQWLPLKVPALGGRSYPVALIGSDGDGLVFQSSTSAAFYSLSK